MLIWPKIQVIINPVGTTQRYVKNWLLLYTRSSNDVPYIDQTTAEKFNKDARIIFNLFKPTKRIRTFFPFSYKTHDKIHC